MSKPAKIIVLISSILFIIVGCFFLYVSWQHNPQCEFHCEGNINWLNWLPYGFVYGFYAFLISIVSGFFLKYCYCWVKSAI